MPSEHIADRGLLYGEACFETMRVVHAEIFAWDAHLVRLTRGLEAFGLCCPEDLFPVCLDAAAKVGPDAMLRLTVSGGEALRGLMPGMPRQPAVHIQAWPYLAPSQALELRSLHWPAGGMARIAKFTSDYAFTIRLLHQARHAGLMAEGEAALFTQDDELLCMETGNILISINGQWHTPQHASVLPGVVRDALLVSGVVQVCPCPTIWLLACDAMAVCNSGCFIRPVSRVNGRKLATEACHFIHLIETLRGRPGVPEDILCA
ncbi:MAG: aminotransferase class IV, partial [Mariprofundaceae bacterium]|nr:aminotransferase class IV [Mariprofundaceae bacterium]